MIGDQSALTSSQRIAAGTGSTRVTDLSQACSSPENEIDYCELGSKWECSM